MAKNQKPAVIETLPVETQATELPAPPALVIIPMDGESAGAQHLNRLDSVAVTLSNAAAQSVSAYSAVNPLLAAVLRLPSDSWTAQAELDVKSIRTRVEERAHNEADAKRRERERQLCEELPIGEERAKKEAAIPTLRASSGMRAALASEYWASVKPAATYFAKAASAVKAAVTADKLKVEIGEVIEALDDQRLSCQDIYRGRKNWLNVLKEEPKTEAKAEGLSDKQDGAETDDSESSNVIALPKVLTAQSLQSALLAMVKKVQECEEADFDFPRAIQALNECAAKLAACKR